MRTPKPSRSRSAKCHTCSTGENAPAGPGMSASSCVSELNEARRNLPIVASEAMSSLRLRGVSFMYCMQSSPGRNESCGLRTRMRQACLRLELFLHLVAAHDPRHLSGVELLFPFGHD